VSEWRVLLSRGHGLPWGEPSALVGAPTAAHAYAATAPVATSAASSIKDDGNDPQ
jgi:hypothetical protein